MAERSAAQDAAGILDRLSAVIVEPIPDDISPHKSTTEKASTATKEDTAGIEIEAATASTSHDVSQLHDILGQSPTIFSQSHTILGQSHTILSQSHDNSSPIASLELAAVCSSLQGTSQQLISDPGQVAVDGNNVRQGLHPSGQSDSSSAVGVLMNSRKRPHCLSENESNVHSMEQKEQQGTVLFQLLSYLYPKGECWPITNFVFLLVLFV